MLPKRIANPGNLTRMRLIAIPHKWRVCSRPGKFWQTMDFPTLERAMDYASMSSKGPRDVYAVFRWGTDEIMVQIG